MQQQIEKIVKDFLNNSGLHTGEVVFEYEEGLNTLWCSISSPDAHLYTGRGGEGLQAINHLVRKAIEKEVSAMAEGLENKNTLSVLVDINNIQKRKIDNLKTIAHMYAERARFFKSSVEVDPMPAFDRRIIHEFLSNAKDVATESTGEGLKRRVVIKYVAEK